MVPAFATGIVPPKPTELVTADAAGGRFSVLVYSKRTGTADNLISLKSDIFVFDKKPSDKNSNPKLLWRSKPEELYEPAIYCAPEWNLKGNPVLVVIRQAGAAATVADIICILADGKVTEMKRLCASRIDVVKLPRTNFPLLAIYESPENSMVSMPKLNAWSGQTFTDVSDSFPGFFLDYLKAIDYKLMMSSDFSIQDRYCLLQLLEKAGCRSEGAQLARMLLSEAKKSSSLSDKKLIAKLQFTLNKLSSR